MEYKLKTIAKSGIDGALFKAQLYRYLNEPEESESICQDILAADPENQAALRLLGLAITDQFRGTASDRYAEVESHVSAAVRSLQERVLSRDSVGASRQGAGASRSAFSRVGAVVRGSDEALRRGREDQAQRQ